MFIKQFWVGLAMSDSSLTSKPVVDNRMWTLYCGPDRQGRDHRRAGWWFEANGPLIPEGESVRVIPADESCRLISAAQEQLCTELAEEFERFARADSDLEREFQTRRRAEHRRANYLHLHAEMHGGAAQAFFEAAAYCRERAAQFQINPNLSRDLELAAKEESDGA